jgi:excisionase family DNA binding protein
MDELIWLTTHQGADRAGRHHITVRRALEAGELHGSQRKTGGRWRIHVECLDAWVAGTDCPHKAASTTSKTA